MTKKETPNDYKFEHYDIRIKGQLDERRWDWLGDLSLTREDSNTLLQGETLDQAELYGILRKIRDAGMTLLSVTRAQD